MKRTILLLFCTLLFSFELNAQSPAVYTVIFTHIEDNSPAGIVGSIQCKQNYLPIRGKLIEMGQFMKSHDIKWTLEPDWKILLAALVYEDSTTIKSTNGKNFLKYLKEDLDVAIDPHSHENQGYNYTDVAYLLDSLGVGGSKVIGGHIWDPSLPQFSFWDRFRVPVYGTTFPWAIWQGNLLIGSGTPNHVNDPQVTGIWRPQDRNHYFIDDPNGNMYCVGKYKDDIATVNELINLYKNKIVDTSCMLTFSQHINYSQFSAQNGFLNIESTILNPLDSLRKINKLVLTDFTSLLEIWKTRFHENACIYDPNNPSSTEDNESAKKIQFSIFPNPISDQIYIQNSTGNEYFELMNVNQETIWNGIKIEKADISKLARGFYLLRISQNKMKQTIKLVKM